MTVVDAFAGIDVAFAKGKRLPIVVCKREGARRIPLLLRDFRKAFFRLEGVAIVSRSTHKQFVILQSRRSRTFELLREPMIYNFGGSR